MIKTLAVHRSGCARRQDDREPGQSIRQYSLWLSLRDCSQLCELTRAMMYVINGASP